MKNYLSRLLILSTVLFALAGCATPQANQPHPHYQTEALRQGMLYFKDQNYRSAFYKLAPEAQAGNPEAQYALGYMYFYGKGVIENRKIGEGWMHAAAAQGDPLAKDALQQIAIEQRVNAKVKS